VLNRAFHPEPLVNVAFPRFETRGRADLVAPMKALGARRLFQRGQAELGGMLPADYLDQNPTWISEASQGVYVKVDEEGTEAAAVTIEESVSDTVGPTESISFVVDRPFLAAIVDEATGALLFIGQVYDPAAT
jgi:serpin B